MPPLARSPKQARSAATRERLLTAGMELFSERGYDHFTLADVAARAGVAVGSIYQRIGSKDDLLLAVYDREMELLDEETRRLYDPAGLGGLTGDEAVRKAIEKLAQLLRRRRGFLRVAIGQSLVQSQIMERGRGHVTVLADAFEGMLLAHAWSHPDPEVAVDVCFRFTFSTLARRTTHGPTFESQREISEERLIELLADACLGLLQKT